MSRPRICQNLRNLWIPFWLFALSPIADAQTLMPTPDPSPSAPPEEETIVPTFETQKLARTFMLDVPAPRGQITDRNGVPLAQNRLSYNLGITFPTPLNFSDSQVLSYTREKIDDAGKLIGRRFRVSDEAILRHYRNRGIMPFEIAPNLTPQEYEGIKDKLPSGMMVRPVYVRIYPNGKVAGQIVGYTGKTGRNPDGIVDNHETIWPQTEGREGLEQTFNEMLTGKNGEYKLTFDKDGRKTSEKLVTPPEPGYNVVTTLDLHLQELAEKALAAKAKRGVLAYIRSKRFRSLDLTRSTQSLAVGSGHSAFAACISVVLSTGIDIQGSRGHCGAGKPCRLPAGPVPMRACDSDRQRYVPQLEKERSRCAKLRAGAHGIMRYMVLSGRYKDRLGADY
jgi:hypothetical protein